MSAPKRDEQKERSMLIALILFIGAGALIFMSLGSDSKKATKGTSASAKTKTSEYQKNVNRHLMLTNEKMQMERRRMDVENFQTADRLQDSRAQKAYQPHHDLDLNTDSRGFDIANEIGRGTKNAAEPSTPDEVVQAELYNRQQANQYDEAYREEYARQFIENARRGGYRVKLSDDLSRVIQVQPIRNPSGANTGFEGGGTQ